MSEICWCGTRIHYCDDGLPDGRVPCECSVGHDHTIDECRVCALDEVETHEAEPVSDPRRMNDAEADRDVAL